MNYVLDLETTVDREKANKTRRELLIEEGATFICATMYAPIGETCDHIYEFYGRQNAENAILNLPEGRYYTWNGARFDNYFIYHLLRKAGYEKQGTYRKNETKKRQIKKYYYDYMISNNRILYLTFRNDNGLVEIRDACLLFSCSLQKFIENTCPEFPKLVGTFDYEKYREFESDFTEQDKAYCRADVKGFAIGIHRISTEFHKEFDMDIMEKYTAGSFAMAYAKQYIPDPEEYFPETPFDRKFVAGGKTFVNPKYRGKIVENITKIDANSFYPSILVDSKLPYGRVEKFGANSDRLIKYLKQNPDKYVFAKLVSGICTYNDMFSPITVLDHRGIRLYPHTVDADDDVYLDDNILRDERFEHDGVFLVYAFDSFRGTLFNYLRHVYVLKDRYGKEGKKGLQLAVKIILNSTYGKFIQRDVVKEYDFFEGIIEPTGQTKTIKAWYIYPPLGAAITANARYKLTEYMNILRDRFVYCDTDSLIFIGECPKEIELGTELGQWKVEANPTGKWVLNGKEEKCDVAKEGVFFDPKTYAINLNGKTEITFCGISDKAIEEKYPDGVTVKKLREDMINTGVTFNVMQSNKTKSGVVLVKRGRTKFYKDNPDLYISAKEDYENAKQLYAKMRENKYEKGD